MICGIDEAGRGPVLGDLVIAGMLIDEKDISILEKSGIKDSKKLTRNRREELYKFLVSNFRYHLIKVSPHEIDESRKRINLNEIEAMKFAKVLDILKPTRAFIDCVGTVPETFFGLINKNLAWRCKLIIEHKADDTYPVVSAASIIAKVERDRGIEKLKEEYGEIGSGYPSDPKTIDFIRRCSDENGAFPEFVRKSWKTSSRALNMRLNDFMK
jgi:ribonuclease HII